MDYLLNFLEPKGTSATFLCRKVTNGRSGSNSYLTQTKLIICQKPFIVVKDLFAIILVLLSQPLSSVGW